MENSAKGTFRRRTWHLHCDPNRTYPPGMLEASKHKHSDSSIKSVRLTLKLPRKNIGHQQKEPKNANTFFSGFLPNTTTWVVGIPYFGVLVIRILLFRVPY